MALPYGDIAAGTVSIAQMRVLYVEDDDNLAFAVEKMLTQDGHSCDRVRSGVGAVKLGQSNEYDVILLDVMLPDIDGYEVIRLLQGAGVDTPVLIQSGLVERDKAMDGLGFGVEDYLIKPFNRDELISQVRRAAARSDRPPPSAANLPAVIASHNAAGTTSEATAVSVIALRDETVPETAAETAAETVTETTTETAAESMADTAAGTVTEMTAETAVEAETSETSDEPPLPDSFPSLPAKIVAEDGRIDIDCTIISVTSGGAVLNVYDELIVCPDDFNLAVAGDKSYRCQSCWRHGDKVGVKFL